MFSSRARKSFLAFLLRVYLRGCVLRESLSAEKNELEFFSSVIFVFESLGIELDCDGNLHDGKHIRINQKKNCKRYIQDGKWEKENDMKFDRLQSVCNFVAGTSKAIYLHEKRSSKLIEEAKLLQRRAQIEHSNVGVFSLSKTIKVPFIPSLNHLSLCFPHSECSTSEDTASRICITIWK